MTAYGDPVAALLRASLAHRDDGPRDFARALLAALDATPADAWIAAEREPLEARLHAVADPPASSAPVPAAAPAAAPVLPPDVAALADASRVRFTDASRALAAGDPRGALEKARPLFAAHRDVLSVQDLRCKIAMALNADWATTRSECARLMELSTDRKK
jgi:hypothetical protein